MGLNLSQVNQKIKDELKKRMDVSKRGVKSLHTRSTWMRMFSTSDKSKILVGGLLDGEKTRGGFEKLYSPKSKDGEKPSYRPTSGLTNLSVDYKGDFGSTRTATIKWICWSFDELEELQGLFLREGKTIIIEWGWSTGDKTQTAGLNPKKVCDIWEDVGVIRKAVIKSNGMFDAMIGNIVGWDWSIRDDGGIDCTTKIMGHGSNAIDKVEGSVDTQKDGDREKMKAFTADLFAKLKSKKYCGKKNTWTGKEGAAAEYIDDENAYVSWGFIEDEIVTKHTSVSTAKAKIGVMKSVSYNPEGEEEGLTLIFRPSVLKTTDGKFVDIDRKAPFKPFKVEDNNGAPLRYLAIHARIVIDAFENGETLEDCLKSLFTEMNNVACDIWDFRIVDHEEKPGQFGVIDANWTAAKVQDMRKKAFVFPTWGHNSIVRDQTLNCDLPDGVALTTMYGANAPKDDKGEGDASEIGVQKSAEKLAKDGPPDECLKDPQIGKEADKVKKQTDSTTKTAKKDSKKGKDKSTNKDRKTDEGVDISKTSEETKDICAGVKKEMVKKVQFVYPIELEIKIDGIAGLQWGNAVHTEFIPKVYKDNVVFQITSINHQLDKTDWTTHIVTVCRVSPGEI